MTDFTTRLRSAAFLASYSYAEGHGPATSGALAALDRSEALVDAAIANVREALAPKPAASLTDASDVFGDDEPAWMAVDSDPCADIDATMRMLGGDPVRLREESPADYLTFGSFLVAAKKMIGLAHYVAVPGAGSDLRYTLYQTGVIGGMR